MLINYKIILYFLGFLILIEGLFMLLSAPISAYFGDPDYPEIILSSLITIFVGVLCWIFFRKAERNIGKREGYIIVSFSWLVFSIFGSLPFVFAGAIPSYTDAFFETISGFTTTGASILTDIESLSHGLLFWRSLTQWLGGMGIIVMSVAIIPILGIGGMQLFIAEVPGPVPDKLHPRIKETAQRLWGIYIIFTISEMILLIIGGMNVFDAICHSFTTMATGGYSTKQASIAYFNSPFIQYVIVFFMFVAGTNFTLSYFALHFDFKKVWHNDEFRFYVGSVAVFSLVISTIMFFTTNLSIEQSFRDAIFQVVSILTTTGFVTADYLSWVPVLSILIFILMFFGGSAGSTGGGIKLMRILLLIRNGFHELKRLLHPNAVIPVRFNNQAVNSVILSNILAFVMFYLFITVSSVIVMSALGYDLNSSFGAVAASLGNIGPGIGAFGPVENYSHLPVFGKWFLSFLMLIGRLEIFTVLILIAPAFWKN